MPKYPSRVRAGTGQGAIDYERQPDLYAVREHDGSGSSEALAIIHDDATSSYAVYQRRSGKTALTPEQGPVYSAGPGGPLAVPTGRVFVRLSGGMRAEDRRREFAATGFEIESIPSYAPNAAWLRPKAGGVARALPAISALKKVPGVVHVEPQLLLARALKR